MLQGDGGWYGATPCVSLGFPASWVAVDDLGMLAQEKDGYLRELDELIPQLEGLMDEKGNLEQQLQSAQASAAELEQAMAAAQAEAAFAQDRCQLLEAQVLTPPAPDAHPRLPSAE